MAVATPTLTAKVFLNTTTDPEGRSLGVLDGYRPEHTLLHVATVELPLLDVDEAGVSEERVHRLAEGIFEVFNVGDDPAFYNPPHPAAVAYRADGHRSLSVGDVVIIGEVALAVDRCGFRRIAFAPA